MRKRRRPNVRQVAAGDPSSASPPLIERERLRVHNACSGPPSLDRAGRKRTGRYECASLGDHMCDKKEQATQSQARSPHNIQFNNNRATTTSRRPSLAPTSPHTFLTRDHQAHLQMHALALLRLQSVQIGQVCILLKRE